MSAAPMSIDPPPLGPVLGVGEEIPDGTGGRFAMLGLIGKGGMGEVHRAAWWKRGAVKSEIVAVKVMLAKNADDPKALVRFGAEGKALKEIHDPNVVQVLAAGIRKKDRLAWMAMELLHGKTLAELLEQQSKVPTPWALAIIRDACNGFQAVHSIAIHRDIKPQNLFLCVDGVIKILDLGASKFLDKGLVLHTTTGFQIGTLPYMSPEQIRNQVLDERSDLFSLTVVLYQILTGRYPFDFGDGLPGWFETCSRIIDKPHVPPVEVAPWLPRHVVEILNKGLSKDPSKRFRSAKEMGEVLTAALNQLAADMTIEPLTTLAATLAPREEAPSSPAPMPRTTVPMSPPVDARSHGERNVGPYDDAPQPRAATPLPYAVTDKVPEVPSESEHDDGFSTWSRPAMLPAEVEVPRVSRIATKRPELGGSPVSAAPVAELAPPPTASNDVDDGGTPEDQDDPYIELLARVIHELPDELRLPFIWNRIDKMSVVEIAERIGVPASTVHERVLVAEAAIKAEIERRLSDGHDVAGAPVSAEQVGEPKELGPKGTVKMIESAATLLARQGKTLEQARAEAGAGAPPSAARPRIRAIVASLALGAVLLALFGGGAALYLLRAWSALLPSQDAPALPAPQPTTPIATATTTSAPTAAPPTTTMPVATATTGATAAPTATPTATVVPSASASATPPTAKRRSGVPVGTPKRRPPRNDAWFRGEDPWKRQGEGPAPATTKKSGPLFGVEE